MFHRGRSEIVLETEIIIEGTRVRVLRGLQVECVKYGVWILVGNEVLGTK